MIKFGLEIKSGWKTPQPLKLDLKTSIRLTDGVKYYKNIYGHNFFNNNFFDTFVSSTK